MKSEAVLIKNKNNEYLKNNSPFEIQKKKPNMEKLESLKMTWKNFYPWIFYELIILWKVFLQVIFFLR